MTQASIREQRKHYAAKSDQRFPCDPSRSLNDGRIWSRYTRAAVRMEHFPPLGSSRNTRNSSPQPQAVSVIARTGRHQIRATLRRILHRTICEIVTLFRRKSWPEQSRSTRTLDSLILMHLARGSRILPRDVCTQCMREICPDIFMPAKPTLCNTRTRHFRTRRANGILQRWENNIFLHETN